MCTFKHLLFLLCFFLAFSSNLASAAEDGFGFGAHAAAHMGFGRVGNSSQTIPTRTVGTLDFQVMPAVRYSSLMGGLLLEYRLIGQLDDTGSTSDTDASGDSLLFGPGISYEISDYKILFNYILGSSYKVSNYDATSTAAYAFKSGGGFQFLFGISVAPQWYFDFTFSQLDYGVQEVDNRETTLADSNEVGHWNFGFGISYSY